jgi:hypothetical protein
MDREEILRKNRERNKEWYQKNKQRKKEYQQKRCVENKEKVRKIQRNWVEKNKERIKEYEKEWYQKNKEKKDRQSRKWFEEHPEKVAEYGEKSASLKRAYYWSIVKNNPEEYAKLIKKRRIYQRTKRIKMIELLGKKCIKCGMDDMRTLEIHHINGKKKGEQFTTMKIKEFKMRIEKEEFMLLCANCHHIIHRE